MKKIIAILLIFALLFAGCTETSSEDNPVESIPSENGGNQVDNNDTADTEAEVDETPAYIAEGKCKVNDECEESGDRRPKAQPKGQGADRGFRTICGHGQLLCLQWTIAL